MSFLSKNVNNVFYKRYILLKLRCFKILRYTIILCITNKEKKMLLIVALLIITYILILDIKM